MMVKIGSRLYEGYQATENRPDGTGVRHVMFFRWPHGIKGRLDIGHARRVCEAHQVNTDAAALDAPVTVAR